MAISDKLNYLIETKQLFKDRLNSLGAEIIESTTFRNYLNWLDTFYNQSSDKTDLAKNGIVGRTSQESTSISGGDEYDSPSPDYPQEINNLSGDVEYKVSGKNLFDGILELGGYANGKKYSNTDNYRSANIIQVKPNTTYTFSINETKQKYVLETYDLTQNFKHEILNSTGTFTTASDVYYINFRCYKNDFTSDYANLKVQLEEGNQATDYEPHQSQSYPINLGDIELCKIGDYQDRIYKDSGKWYIEKKIGKVVLNGSENWEKHATTTADIYMIFIPNSIGYEYGSGKIAPAICNSFIARALGSFSDDTYGVFGITPSLQTRFFVGATGSHYANINAWKQYLANNNMIVYFALATPTTTEITQENYPTLYSQLLAIQEFLTKYKINKEFLLDYSSPEIEY